MGLSIILGSSAKLILHALHKNTLPFINDGEHVDVPEISTGMSIGVIAVVLLITTGRQPSSARGGGGKPPPVKWLVRRPDVDDLVQSTDVISPG